MKTTQIAYAIMGVAIHNTAPALVSGDIGGIINDGGCKVVTCKGTEQPLPRLGSFTPQCPDTPKTCIRLIGGDEYYIHECSGCDITYIQSIEIAGCPNKINIPMSCEAPIKCDDCVSDTDFTAITIGYERKTIKNCLNGNCQEQYTYRCAAGYYGSSTNGTSGCTQCPTWTGVYTDETRTTIARGTSSVGATDITDCYITSGTYYDATGTFKITGTCQYNG